MNRKLALAIAIVLAAAGNAFADDITIDTNTFTSTASRAQVQAELVRFQQAGANPWADEYNPLAQFQSSKTRAQVQAEYLEARDAVAAFASEHSGSSYLARAQVPETVLVAQRTSAQ
jgi:hypothetical protein